MTFLGLLVAAALSLGGGQALYEGVHLLSDPGSRVVSVAIRFPAGSAQDPIGSEGRAFLFGRVLERTTEAELQRHNARLQVDVGPNEFLLTLLAPPHRWEEAYVELERALFTGTPPDSQVEAARTELIQILTFETGSPVRAFEAERAFLLHGSTDPAARPLRGTILSAGGIGPADLIAFRSEHLRRETGIVAVTGPIAAPEVEAVVGIPVRTLTLARSAALPSAPAASEGAAPAAAGTSTRPPLNRALSAAQRAPLRVPTASSGRRAWETADRVVMDRELTSTWMAVAFPFPTGTPPLLLDFLAHLITEELNRTPPDPGLYGAQVWVERIRDAPVLVLSASVDPFEADLWEDRLDGALDRLGEAPPTGSFFELTRRRFRSNVFLELASPERMVQWMARQTALGHTPPSDPEVAMWQLEREAVAEAARAGGPPRVLVYGPQGLTNP